MAMYQRAGLAAFLFVAVAAPVSLAGVIDDHNPTSFDARYDRFISGYATAPVPNTSPSFIGLPYDLSGIGWKSDQPFFSVTMVSPREFIGAAHVGYPAGSTLDFYDSVSNIVRSYTVQTTRIPTTTFVNSQGQVQTLPSDVMLGTLTAPIPATDHVGFFSVATGATQQFVGQPMLNYGQNNTYGAGNMEHLGRNTISQTGLASFQTDTNGDPVNEATEVATYAYNPSQSGNFYLIAGDSGGPSFIPVDGLAALIGGHYGVSNNTTNPNPGDISVDTLLAPYITQLDAFMAMDTDATHPLGYSLTLTPVPEPGTLLLTGLTACGGVWLRARRGRVQVKAADVE